jgi:CheY-like chemotaxis protein
VGKEQQGARHRILIVDDEESTRLLLARILSADLDADVQLAGTCEQAIRLAETHPYDVILLDLLMPGIGGRAVLDEIRTTNANAATPVIIVSIVTDKATIEGCMRAGATAYHPKPVRREELVETIRRHVGAQRASPARK